jgi:hypothetical protein
MTTMSDVMDLLWTYAESGAVVDGNLIAKVGREIERLRKQLAEAQTENTALSRQLDVVVDAYECGGWNSLLDMQQLHLMREWYQDVLAVQGEAR